MKNKKVLAVLGLAVISTIRSTIPLVIVTTPTPVIPTPTRCQAAVRHRLPTSRPQPTIITTKARPPARTSRRQAAVSSRRPTASQALTIIMSSTRTREQAKRPQVRAVASPRVRDSNKASSLSRKQINLKKGLPSRLAVL